MCIGMQAIGLHIRQVLKQSIQNLRRLVGPAGNETAKQSNVIVRNMSIRDATGFAVTNVMFSKQIAFVGFKVGSVSGGGLARTPLLR